MSDFTLRLLRNIEKTIQRKYVLVIQSANKIMLDENHIKHLF